MSTPTSSTHPSGPLSGQPRRPLESLLSPLWRSASFAVLLYVGWMLLGGLFQPRLESFEGPGVRLLPLLYYCCLDAFALALSAAYLCGLEGNSFRALGLSFDAGWLRQAAVGVAWGAAVISATALLLFAVRAATASSVSLTPFPHFLSLVAFLLLAAAFEELAFRGYAFQRAAQVIGPVAAGSLASLLFGFAHSGNPQATVLSTLNTILAGALLAIARVRTRALWMPIGLHFAWNFFLGPVFSFPVSGYRFGGAALSASSAGLAWLSGGTYGPEGGAALTVILAVAIPLALLRTLPASLSSFREDSGVH